MVGSWMLGHQPKGVCEIQSAPSSRTGSSDAASTMRPPSHDTPRIGTAGGAAAPASRSSTSGAPRRMASVPGGAPPPEGKPLGLATLLQDAHQGAFLRARIGETHAPSAGEAFEYRLTGLLRDQAQLDGRLLVLAAHELGIEVTEP